MDIEDLTTFLESSWNGEQERKFPGIYGKESGLRPSFLPKERLYTHGGSVLT